MPRSDIFAMNFLITNLFNRTIAQLKALLYRFCSDQGCHSGNLEILGALVGSVLAY